MTTSQGNGYGTQSITVVISGRGGYKKASEVLPTKRGIGKSLAMLEGGHTQFRGSFNTGA